MRALRRLLACLLGIASPSRVALRWTLPEPRTWLDRWERRIDDRVPAMPRIMRTDEVQVFDMHGAEVKRIDVSGRSERAMRRVLNRERRRAGAGMTVRRAVVFS